MGPEGSMPCSQEHITVPCPQSYESSPPSSPLTTVIYGIFNVSSSDYSIKLYDD
jgi:hypothetical protein